MSSSSTCINSQQAAQPSQQRSNFFSLSPELRIRIYELCLLPQERLNTPNRPPWAVRVCGIDNARRCSSEWVKQPPLTRVSHLIRRETLPIFYGMNHFVINAFAPCADPRSENFFDADFHFCGAQSWLRQIGPDNLKLIRHLDVCYWANEVRNFAGDPDKYSRDLAMYLERQGVSLPATTVFLVISAGEKCPPYWQPLDFELGRERVMSEVKRARTEMSTAYWNQPGGWLR